jgi:hypothetical protein
VILAGVERFEAQGSIHSHESGTLC